MLALVAFIFMVLGSGEAGDCRVLDTRHNVDTTTPDTTNWNIGDQVEVTCSEGTLVPWLSTESGTGSLECRDTGTGSGQWEAAGGDVAWSDSVADLLICVQCVDPNHSCQNGNCVNNICECSMNFVKSSIDPRSCREQTCDDETDFCKNYGTCSSDSGILSCTCKSGTRGETCHIIDPVCESDPCKNGGTCQPDTSDRQVFDSFTCTCMEGYIGDTCEEAGCPDDPYCDNGGQCIVVDNQIACDCLTGTVGVQCGHFTSDPCFPNPCLNVTTSCSRSEEDFTTHQCIVNSATALGLSVSLVISLLTLILWR